MGKVDAVALDAAWEVMALAKVLRKESAQGDCDALVVRGVSARIYDLAGMVISSLDDGGSSDQFRQKLRGV